MFSYRLSIVLFSILLSSVVMSQDDLYVFSCDKNQNLESALESFADTYDLDLSYPAYVMNQIYPGQVNESSADLNSLLTEVLAPNEIEYEFFSDSKVLLRKIAFEEMQLFGDDEVIELTGVVTDSRDASPLEFATVSIPSIQVGTYTDPDGSYTLLLSGKYLDEKVVISFVGYESNNLTVRDILLNKKLILQPRSSSLDEVTITSTEPLVIINKISAATGLKLKKLLNLSNSALQGNDILRKLQMLPGLSQTDDQSSSIAIRGADDSETLVLIDGIPLYKTEHFYGIFGNINGSYVDDVTLYKNEMPINYSGNTGGLVSIQSANRIDEFTGVIDVNMLTSSASVAIPLTDHWSMHVAGRASYNDVTNAGFFNTDSDFTSIDKEDFNRPAVLGVTPTFDFYDMNAKLAFDNEGVRANLNFFRSNDVLNSNYENTFQTRRIPGTNRRVENTEIFINDHSWSNTGASLNVAASLSNDWTLSSTSYLTEMVDEGSLKYVIQNDIPEFKGFSLNNKSGNSITDYSTTAMVSKGYDNNLYSIGLKYVNHDNQLNVGEDDQRLFVQSQVAREYVGFASTEQRLTDQLAINVGIRGTYYDLNEKIYIAPQVAASYTYTDWLKFKASVSRNYQYVRELSYTTRFGNERELLVISDDQRIPVGASNNYMIGAALTQNEWLLDVEVYNVQRENVLNFTTLLPRLLNGDNNEERKFAILSGEGQTIGMDALLTYQKNGYTGMLSYTLSKSENQFKEIFKNQPFPSQDDRRHQVSLTNAYSFDNFTLSGNVVYASGRTYTDLSVLQIGQNRKDTNPSDFLKRLPYYFRTDLSADYSYEMPNGQSLVFGISVLNLFNRNNVKYRQFTAAVPILDRNGDPKSRSAVLGTETNQLERILNVSVGLKF